MSDSPIKPDVVDPDVSAVANASVDADGSAPRAAETVGVAETTDEGDTSGDSVTEPAKVMRIGSMIKQLLEEVRAANLDEASRERLAEVYERSVVELSSALSPDLQEELRTLSLPFDHDEVPSEAELRVAKAQLVGWLEGLFHGIQASMMAQQFAAQQQQQLQQLKQLPGQAGNVAPQPGTPAQPPQTGTYL